MGYDRSFVWNSHFSDNSYQIYPVQKESHFRWQRKKARTAKSVSFRRLLLLLPRRSEPITLSNFVNILLFNQINAAMYSGSVMIPSSSSPILPSANLYAKEISRFDFTSAFNEFARVLPLFTSIGTTLPSF